MDWLSVAGIAVSNLAYPILLFSRALLAILLFVAAPFIHACYLVLYGCWWPFYFLAQVETLYIFFGVATLVGIITGTSLHYLSVFLASALKIDDRPEEKQIKSAEGNQARKLGKPEARGPRPEHYTRGR